jgi:hypothetical protein
MKTLRNVLLRSVILFTALAATLVLPIASLAQINITSPPGINQGQPVAATSTTNALSDPAFIDAVAVSPNGTDISTMINTVYISTTLCPSLNGCVIDARGATGGQLVMNQNPFAGRNVRVKLLLGNLTYIACKPWVVPQAGIVVEGSGLTGSTTIGTIIKAGSAADCGTAFPNGTSLIQTTRQHGPFGSGNYSAVIQDGGSPPTNPTTDKFGSQWRFLTVDANDLADFCIFSASMEEKSGVFHFGCRGAKTACGFWDRAFQDGSGSGPSHFNIFDTTCDISSTTNNLTRGWVYEGAPTSVAFSSGTCTTTPHAYAQVSGGAVANITMTYGGLCTTPPTAVTVNTSAAVTPLTINTTGTCTTGINSNSSGICMAGGMVSSASAVGTDVTMTTSTVHGLHVGEAIVVSLVVVSSGNPYNGNATVTQVTSSTVFHYTLTPAPGTYMSMGKVIGTTLNNVLIQSGGSGYLNGVRGAGPWIERSTLRGTSATNRMADAIWIEASYGTHISDIHCEWLGTNPNDPMYGLSGGSANCVNFGGSGNAQNNAGRIENIDVGNNSGGGQIVHLAAGGVSGAAPSNQGTSLANIAFESVTGSTAVAIQDDTVPPLPTVPSLPLDGTCIGCISLKNGNGNGVIPQYISGWGTGRNALRSLASAFTATTTAFTTVGNWAWTLQANKSYALSCQISYKAATTSGGLALAVNGTASSSNLWVGANVPLSANTFVNGVATTFGTAAVNSAVTTASTNFMAIFSGQITVGSTFGTFQVQAATTTNGETLTINPGSWCEVKDAN